MVKWPFKNNFDLLSALKENKPVKESEINVEFEEVQKLAQWYSTVPSYTTVRINTSNTNAQQVIKIIKDQLLEQFTELDVNDIPGVIQDEILKDCIIVSPWNMNEELQNANCRQYHEIIVDVQCGVSVLRGANVFAPGVMGITTAVKEGDIVYVLADLSGKCLKGFLKPYNDPHKKFLGYGIAKMNRRLLFETKNQPVGIAVEMKQTVSGVPSFICPPEFGLLQNYPSILCTHVLDPQEDDIILDMCASPGNKTTHIASLLKGKSCVIALDKTEKKVRRIRENCINQRLHNVKAFVYNAIKAVRNDLNMDRDVFQGPPFNINTFDRILLDAPCSALGQRPQLHNTVEVQHLNSHSNLQKRLFKSAVDLLKPSGVLVYSTCTLLVPENEGIVSWALDEFPELCLVAAEPIIGSAGNFDCGLSREQCNLVQKFGPYQSSSSLPYQRDTVGFFIAKFIKHQNS